MVLTKRARSQAQKHERRQALMAAAVSLLQTKSFSEINIAMVAKAAKMAKGTVFLYFQTKEELFLAVAYLEFEHWFNAMDLLLQKLQTAKRKPTKTQTLQALQDLLSQHVVLARLIAILHVVLEHNVRFSEAVEFKRMLAGRLTCTGTKLEAVVPFLKHGQGQKLIVWMYAMVIGFSHLAFPAPVMEQVYASDPELGKLRIDFSEEYFAALSAILDGWQIQNSGATKGQGGKREH